MNDKLEEFKERIRGKKVAVLGIGISNTPLLRYLSELGVDITAFDKAAYDELKQTLEKLNGLDLKYSLGENYLKNLKGFDVIFKTPKVRFDIPELIRERARGADITSEMEAFFELCPAQIFAVTGSDGKTTTTTLIYNMLKEQGYKCWLGGNIGIPLLSRIDEIKESDKVVLELSSFQLHTMRRSPSVAVITNISPNHLDVHKSMDEYIEAKKNIYKFQNESDKVVINYDNEITRNLSGEVKGKTVYFSRVNALAGGAVVEKGKLVYKNESGSIEIISTEEILLPGVHNIENYLAAISAVIDYVEIESIYKVAATFKGVEHRIELVREINGVKFYNSSIDSSPNRTIAALNTFKQKVILIAGGMDKNIPYDDMGAILVEKVKCLILIGPTGEKIRKALHDEVVRTGQGKDIKIIKCTTYEEVVKAAYGNATYGDIIILSPASTSFDMFKNFEERGNRFKDIVNSINS